MSALADVTVVIVTYNSAGVLESCLASLPAQTSVIVVDNASTDESVEIAENAGAQVLKQALNQGFGRACNAGVVAANTRYILLINPDAALDAGALEEMLEAENRYPGFGLLAPRLIEPDGRFFFSFQSKLSKILKNSVGTKRYPEGDCCVPMLSGAVLFFEREIFLRLGGFDPEIFLFYEDDDLCRRFVDAGYALVHVHGAIARHIRGASSQPSCIGVYMRRLHLEWSSNYVAQKYGLPQSAVKTLLLSALKLAFGLLTFNKLYVARHLGSFSGAKAWLMGRSALALAGLLGEENV
jgi:N-acetylglucosaminyl-diphospho-decaprenol L-rhamnosyltransferase